MASNRADTGLELHWAQAHKHWTGSAPDTFFSSVVWWTRVEAIFFFSAIVSYTPQGSSCCFCLMLSEMLLRSPCLYCVVIPFLVLQGKIKLWPFLLIKSGPGSKCDLLTKNQPFFFFLSVFNSLHKPVMDKGADQIFRN